MRDFEQEPLRMQTQRTRRLEMRVLTLPHRAVGLRLLVLYLFFSVLLSLYLHTLPRLWPIVWYFIVRRLVLPYDRIPFFDNPNVWRNDSVDHITCLSDRVVSHCEKVGVVQEKTATYATLRLLIETKDLLCLYDSPTTAIVILKADLRSEELEQLRATILKAVADVPPPIKDIYRKIGWWKGPKAEHA